MSMDSNIKSECKRYGFSLNHDNPSDFFKSLWQTSDRKCLVYLIYRWIFAILYSTTLLYSLIHHGVYKGSLIYYPLYLTNWGNFMNAIYAVVAAILVTRWFLSQQYQDKLMHQRYITIELKFVWFLQNICPVVAIMITTLYWGFVHNKGGRVFPVDTLNILNHVTNTVFMVTEVFIVANPVRILHFIYPLGVAIVYAILTLFHYAFDGVNVRGEPFIYKNLDWNRPSFTGPMTLGVFFIIIILHVLIYFLYKLKLILHKQLVNTIKQKDFLCDTYASNSLV